MHFSHKWAYRECTVGKNNGRIIRECSCGKKQIELFFWIPAKHYWVDLIEIPILEETLTTILEETLTRIKIYDAMIERVKMWDQNQREGDNE